MTFFDGVGWGSAGWGSGPWGGNTAGVLQLVSAIASRENAIQLEFTRAIFLSGLLDNFDASRPEFYTVAPVVGTVGLDGTTTRPVTVTAAAVVPAPGFIFGQIIELTLDRPMTPFPGIYLVTCSTLIKSADLSVSIDPSADSANCFAAFKAINQPSIDTPVQSRDFANPQTLSGNLGSSNPLPFDPRSLGVFVVDDTGDYAFDEGLASFKKRMFRRLVSVPGGFLHLGQNYGVGVPSFGKKLALASIQDKLAAEAEKQIAREPEVEKVKVTSTTDTTGLFRLNILVKLKSGKSQKYSVPFPQ